MAKEQILFGLNKIESSVAQSDRPAFDRFKADIQRASTAEDIQEIITDHVEIVNKIDRNGEFN